MELKFSGLAPSPAQLEKIMKASQGQDEEEDAPQYEFRHEEYPDGTAGGILPTLRNEVTQIIYSTHWEYQKRVLDQVESVIASDRQWAICRRILLGIMTEQVEKTRLLISQRIKQEMFRDLDLNRESEEKTDE